MKPANYSDKKIVNKQTSVKEVIYERMSTSDVEIKMLVDAFIAHCYNGSIDMQKYHVRPYAFNKYLIARTVYEKCKLHGCEDISSSFNDDETKQILDIISTMKVDYKSIKVDYLINRLNSIAYAMFLLDSLSINNIDNFFGGSFNKLSVYSYIKQIEGVFIKSFDKDDVNSGLIDSDKFLSECCKESESSYVFSSGSKFVDQITRGGFREGDTVAIASRPGNGKSTFCIDMIVKNNHLFFNRDTCVLYISPDMHYKYVYMRYISNHDNISFYDVENYVKSGKFKSRIPIIVSETSSIEQIENIIVNYGDKLDVVIIDYIQLMHSNASANFSRNDQITKAMLKFKQLARLHKFVLIVAAQLNRESEKRSNGSFMLSDLRDSGSIEHESDMVMFLNKDGDDMKIEVVKNRNGPIGCTVMRFDYNKFMLIDMN